MSDLGELKEVKGLTAKQIKELAKPEFAANPDKFYPTATLRKLGFERAQCKAMNGEGKDAKECGHYYWRHTPKKMTCGDSQCEKKYTFIGIGTGKGRNGPKQQKITYAEAWQGFRRSLSSARVPCTPIPRYPVVARWRADVDYVAAGIFCFQPYCVTGELQPPANPLICPQFCLRFNDLDNIGLTGRHYSGFIMLGIQVFNSKDNYKFWNSECVEFNYRWLTEELMIDPDEITFIEDVWAGGGNLGPSIEFFVGGLELGNMVFMQYKTFPDGRREPLQVQVIDVGIGLERVPWLINGSATSYCDVFPRALEFLLSKTGLKISGDIWDRFGPYSCLLNVDEVDDVDKTWAWIGKQINVPASEIKAAIEPIRDIYMILDHTRSVLMAIEDGSLPSNVGGASNIRNVLRRCFTLIEKHGWWKALPIDTEFMQLFEHHRADLATVYGDFKPYPSFNAIIKLEYNRWKFTDQKQRETLQALLAKQKNQLSMEDWIRCITTFGLPAEFIAKTSGLPIPGNLYHAIAEKAEQTVKVAPAQLYSTAHLKPTDSLYFTNHKKYDFEATILEVFPNITDGNIPNIVVLDQSAFYPTSGGQEHDTGTLTIEGKTYRVVDALKVGPAVLHVLDEPLPKDIAFYKNKKVTGLVDSGRREQLRNNHTATHIVFAACRRVLGPHVWQHGAKKTVRRAHLDITHFDSLTFEQLQQVENEANRIVHSGKEIKKGWFPKDAAEQAHGYTLYQGGIVPGNEVRVVQILDTDVEACCGTHADSTSEVGTIKIQKAKRISDGILRLYYVAGEGAIRRTNKEAAILANLIQSWGVTQKEVVPTATRFFHESKTYRALAEKQSQQLIDLQIKCHVLDPSSGSLAVFKTDESNPRLFISTLPNFAEKLRDTKKGVVFIGETFMYGILGDPSAYDFTASFQPFMIAAVTKEEERLAKKRAEDAKAPKETKVEVIDDDSDSDDDEKAKPKKKATGGAPVAAAPKAETKEPAAQKAKTSGIRLATSVNARGSSAADGPKKKAAAVKVDVDAGFTPSEADRKKPAAPVAAAAAAPNGGEKKAKEPKGKKEDGGNKEGAKAENGKKGKEPKGKKESAPEATATAAPVAAEAPKEEAKKGKGKKEAKKEAGVTQTVADPAVVAVSQPSPKEEAKKGKGKKEAAPSKKEEAAAAPAPAPASSPVEVADPAVAAVVSSPKEEAKKGKGKKEAKKEATPSKKEEAAPVAAVSAPAPTPAPVAAAPSSPEPKKAAAKTEAAKAERPKSAKPKAEPKSEAPKEAPKGGKGKKK